MTEEAKLLFEDENALATASVDQLGKVLTTCVRRARFILGDPLMRYFESGLIMRIVRRADALTRESD